MTNRAVSRLANAAASTDRCFACDRQLRGTGKLVTCADEQTVFVGFDCFEHVRSAGSDGYQPPKGGPRLYLLQNKPASNRTAPAKTETGD